MNIEQLCFDCARAVLSGAGITLSLPKGERWPVGFPRGQLLSVQPETGLRNVAFDDPARILSWLQRAVRASKAATGGAK